MFLPFNLVEVGARKAVYEQVMDWCQAEERNVYFDNTPSATTSEEPLPIEYRFLTKTELVLLETHLNQTGQTHLFGGFVGGPDSNSINSLCFFTLDNTKEHAWLSAFVSNKKAGPR